MVVYLGKATPASGSGGAGGEAVWGDITGTLSDQTDLSDALGAKQDTLVSGTNIKTINSESILGSGNITISGSVPNQNTAAGATNPLEFWEGTEAQWNTGGGSTTYYNWESAGGVTTLDISASGLNSVTYGNGKYVAVSNSGTVYYSTDKQNWSNVSLGVTLNKPRIIYGNGKFAIYNAYEYSNSISSTIYVASDSDITTWSTITAADTVRGMGFGNNLWVIACSNKKIYTSSDLSTLTEVYTHTNNIVSNIGYANGKFAFADESGSSYKTYISTDNCQTWTQVTDGGARMDYMDYCYVCGVGNTFYLYTSNDGDPYTTKAFTDASSSQSMTSVTGFDKSVDLIQYVNDTYVGIFNNYWQTSSDGINWTQESVANVTLKAATYGDTYLGITKTTSLIATYGAGASVYTTDENPTTESTVYSAVSTPSALTITSVSTGEITCSDTNTYTYNASGNQTVSQTVGEAHPDWICMIEGVGVKKGSTVIASVTTVDQTYNATSANAQSGVAVASGISDTLGTIETALSEV